MANSPLSIVITKSQKVLDPAANLIGASQSEIDIRGQISAPSPMTNDQAINQALKNLQITTGLFSKIR